MLLSNEKVKSCEEFVDLSHGLGGVAPSYPIVLGSQELAPQNSTWANRANDFCPESSKGFRGNEKEREHSHDHIEPCKLQGEVLESDWEYLSLRAECLDHGDPLGLGFHRDHFEPAF